MYKLLIVDDEQIIREGIAANTDFASLGIELVGSCENGVDALEVIKERQPDMVMTDINMPFMNGMELAEQVLTIYPLTKIIFLTGYDRFEYVKQALRLKITDYLVKPILPKELLKIFSKVIKSIDQERLEDAQINRLKDRVAETEPVLRDRCLNRLLRGPMGTTELLGKLQSLNISMDMNLASYQALCIAIEGRMDYNELDTYLRNVMALTLSYTEAMMDCLVFRTYDDKIVVLMGNEDAMDMNEASELLADKIHAGMVSRCHATVGIGKSVRQFEDIYKSYSTAEEVLEYRVFSGSGGINSYVDLERKRGRDQLYFAGYAAAIHKEVKSGTLNALLHSIDQAFDVLAGKRMHIEAYYIHVQSILTSILLSLEEQGISYKDIYQGGDSPLLHLHTLGSLEEMKLWLKDFCQDILSYVVEDREDYQTGQAKSAVLYIREHYGDTDISPQKVC